VDYDGAKDIFEKCVKFCANSMGTKASGWNEDDLVGNSPLESHKTGLMRAGRRRNVFWEFVRISPLDHNIDVMPVVGCQAKEFVYHAVQSARAWLGCHFPHGN
jgi:hypothetical protein